MFKNILLAGVFAATTSLSWVANANLITNGSFEDNDVPTNKWRYYNSGNVNGWGGSNIEIWDHLFGEAAYEGRQFAELNAHPYNGNAFSIFQDINTYAGQTYEVSFAYQARRSNNESFLAEILDINTLLEEWTLDDHTRNGWSVFTGTFVAASDQSRIQFTTITPEAGTVGNFLDDVRVSAVPEPGTLGLLGLGALCLAAARRRA